MALIFKITLLNLTDGSVHANLMQSYYTQLGQTQVPYKEGQISQQCATAAPQLTTNRF